MSVSCIAVLYVSMPLSCLVCVSIVCVSILSSARGSRAFRYLDTHTQVLPYTHAEYTYMGFGFWDTYKGGKN